MECSTLLTICTAFSSQRILAREAKFRELGLAQAEPQRPQRQPQPKRRKVALEAPTEPRRRSSRVQMLAGGPSAQDDTQAQAGNSVGGWLEPAEEPAPVWEDSALRHYLVAETCQEASASAPPAGGGAQREGLWADSFVDATGFSDLACFLEARTLARAYRWAWGAGNRRVCCRDACVGRADRLVGSVGRAPRGCAKEVRMR